MGQKENPNRGRDFSNSILGRLFNTEYGQTFGRNTNPNVITAVGLAAGISAEAFIAEGDFRKAAPFVTTSLICELLDGGVAKWFNKKTEFGAAFDSIADRIVDVRWLNGMSMYAKSQGWKETEVLAEAAKITSLNVSLNRAVVVRDGRDVPEDGIGSRRYRVGLVVACLAGGMIVPAYTRQIWDVGLTALNGLAGYTAYDRLKEALPADVFENIEHLFEPAIWQEEEGLRTLARGYLKEAGITLLGMDRAVRGLPTTVEYSQTRTEGILREVFKDDRGLAFTIGALGLARKAFGLKTNIPEIAVFADTAVKLGVDLLTVYDREKNKQITSGSRS